MLLKIPLNPSFGEICFEEGTNAIELKDLSEGARYSSSPISLFLSTSSKMSFELLLYVLIPSTSGCLVPTYFPHSK
uniref:Uncharacterized protein n=1 Tax=Lepeophtheirus salmonis TaxID=72036 RepID=A0A0K2VJS2_LEPSM